MRVIGFNLQKGQIRLTVLEGSKSNPVLVDSQKLVTRINADSPQLMDWYKDSFSRILDQYGVDLVAYRLSLLPAAPKIEQIQNLYYPYGILNFLCFQKTLRTSELSSQKLKYPQSIGHPKTSDLYQLCDQYISGLCVNDKPQKDSALTAWFSLE